VKGRNPFKDLRVRKAVYQAINVPLIIDKVLRGQAVPTGAFLSPLVDGSPAELEQAPALRPGAFAPVAGRGRLPQRLFRDAGLRERRLARKRLPGGGRHAHAGGHSHHAAHQPHQPVFPQAHARARPASSSLAGPPAPTPGTRSTACSAPMSAAGWAPSTPAATATQARRADRQHPHRTQRHAPPRHGGHRAAPGGRRTAAGAAVPACADLGHGQAGAGWCSGPTTRWNCAGCASSDALKRRRPADGTDQRHQWSSQGRPSWSPSIFTPGQLARKNLASLHDVIWLQCVRPSHR
jgi:hypothetical protein